MALAVTPTIEKCARCAVLCLAALLCFAGRPVEAAPTRPPPDRIVSLNLCADQLLLALADRRQIAALTSMAKDPAMSAEAAKASGIAVSRGAAEDVLALEPDLVVVPPGWRNDRMAALKRQNYRTLVLSSAESYPQILAQIRLVAEAIGHPARGEALIRDMNAGLARIPRPRRHPVAAYYQRRGYLTGTGTLVDDLMRRVGLRNLAGVLGKSALARVTLEEMVAATPDYLIVETATDRVIDQGTELLHHPALAAIPRLRLPEAWTVCGGPFYVSAARSLAAQLRARPK